jgi:hypothetical protein
MTSKFASIHIDMDSPDTLLRFWGYDETCANLDRFHEVAMTRALRVLRDCGVRATFFCIGEELDRSATAAAMVREAQHEGHEIANHTYSHPFGLTTLGLAAIRREIVNGAAAIRRATGVAPRGFRGPGYATNAAVLQILEDFGYDYDASAFWSVLHPIMKTYRRARSGRSAPESFGEASIGLPWSMYYPERSCWTRPGPRRSIVEIPLPRTRLLGLPFYNNFHLATPALYRRMATDLMHQPSFVYLVHLVEFTDLTDGLPARLRVHPNIAMDAGAKMRALADTLGRLMRRYRIITSAEAVREFKGRAEGVPLPCVANAT